MRRFAALYRRLDAIRSSTTDAAVGADQAELQALSAWLQQSEPADAAWGVQLLLGWQRRRWISGVRLRQIAGQTLTLPDWLIEDCRRQVGDNAEALALLWPDPAASTTEAASANAGLRHWMEELIPAAARPGDAQAEAVRDLWNGLDAGERLVLNKLFSGHLCSGPLRGGVELAVLSQALASVSELDPQLLRRRLQQQGESRKRAQPSATWWRELLRPAAQQEWMPLQPAALQLPPAPPLPEGHRPAGLCSTWRLDWRWPGLRVQLIRHRGHTSLVNQEFSRLEAALPALLAAASALPETLVMDAVLLLWDDQRGRPEPLKALEQGLRLRQKQATRQGRSRHQPQSAGTQAEPAQQPAPRLLGRDLLQLELQDLRAWPLQQRLRQLEQLLQRPGLERWLRLPQALPLQHWSELEPWQAQARSRGAEGLLLRRLDADASGSTVDPVSWSLPLQPLRLMAVLLYVQRGRTGLADSEYTFGIWNAAAGPGSELVTFCRTAVGLENGERRELETWARQHTLERYGPVRAVEPTQLFELALDGVQPSSRHRCGLVAQQPRIERWLRQGMPDDAASLGDLL